MSPDITLYKRGNTGLDYVTTLDGDRPGPHVVVNALTHGSEYCGAVALDFLFRHGVRPTRGRLTLSFSNVEAYRRFDPSDPTSTCFVDEDFNRLWTPEVLDGPRDSVDLLRARELRPIFDGADFLLDLHSMQTGCVPLSIAGPLPKGRDLAAAIGYPAHVVIDAGHAAGVRLRDYAGFADPASAKCAALIECGQHWEAASAEVAIKATLRFLRNLDMIERDFAAAHWAAVSLSPQTVIEVTHAVTIKNEAFAFVREFGGLEVIPATGTVLAHDGDEPIATPYDDSVLVTPSRCFKPRRTAFRLGRYVAPPRPDMAAIPVAPRPAIGQDRSRIPGCLSRSLLIVEHPIEYGASLEDLRYRKCRGGCRGPWIRAAPVRAFGIASGPLDHLATRPAGEGVVRR